MWGLIWNQSREEAELTGQRLRLASTAGRVRPVCANHRDAVALQHSAHEVVAAQDSLCFQATCRSNAENGLHHPGTGPPDRNGHEPGAERAGRRAETLGDLDGATTATGHQSPTTHSDENPATN